MSDASALEPALAMSVGAALVATGVLIAVWLALLPAAKPTFVMPAWVPLELGISTALLQSNGPASYLLRTLRHRSGPLFGLTSRHAILFKAPSIERLLARADSHPLSMTMLLRTFGASLPSHVRGASFFPFHKQLTAPISRVFVNEAGATAAVQSTRVAEKMASLLSYSADPAAQHPWERAADVRILVPGRANAGKVSPGEAIRNANVVPSQEAIRNPDVVSSGEAIRNADLIAAGEAIRDPDVKAPSEEPTRNAHALPSQEAAEVEVTLEALLRDFGACLAIPTLFGHDFLARTPSLLHDLWTFDSQAFSLLIAGIPSWLPLPSLRAGIKARTRLQTAMAAYFRRLDQHVDGQPVDFGADMSDVSVTERERNAIFRQHGLSVEQRGSIEVSILWAQNANSSELIFWFLLYVYATEGLVTLLRKEVETCLTLSAGVSGAAACSSDQDDFASSTPPSLRQITSLDIPALSHHCPLLKSCFLETLRLVNQPTSIRYLSHPLAVPEAGTDAPLPSGTWVSAPHAAVQRDESVFPDAGVFIPDRFLEAHVESASVPKSPSTSSTSIRDANSASLRDANPTSVSNTDTSHASVSTNHTPVSNTHSTTTSVSNAATNYASVGNTHSTTASVSNTHSTTTTPTSSNTNHNAKRTARYGRLKPWGTGTGICKGRTFAERQVLTVVACFIALWDLRPVDGETELKIPGLVPGTGVARPREKLRVVMRRRQFP